MLINTDRLKKKHEDMALDVEDLLNRLYMDKKLDATNNQRLKELWTNDFLLVSSARAASTDVPESWDELKPFIADSIKRITSQKILIVNCDNDDTPDFEEPAGCWAILVGGQKLSRGYTIEGLTTSYFSRKPGQLDTLVQMARWYGFRKNYSDLVRLYIPETLPREKKRQSSSNKRTTSKIKKYHLLDAFRFGAKVEEAFRNNLIQYSKDLRPIDIPPLVQYEFEDFPHDFKYLKPTAPNKMRNARFETFHLGGVIKTVTRIGGERSQMHNQRQLITLLDSCSVPFIEKELIFEKGKCSVLTGLTSSQNYLSFLRNIHYPDNDVHKQPNVIHEQIEALDEMDSMPWRVIMFMRRDVDKRIQLSQYSLPHWIRDYNIDNGVLVYNKPLNPPDKATSAWFAKHNEGIGLTSHDIGTSALQDEKSGVIYIVPFSNKSNKELYYLWCAVYPGTGKEI